MSGNSILNNARYSSDNTDEWYYLMHLEEKTFLILKMEKDKKMRVGKWDVTKNALDYNSLVPKI